MKGYLFFCSHERSKYPEGMDPVWVFSNWFLRDYIGYNGLVYNCIEQEMMHQKAELFEDTETANKILASKDPRVIKALGRNIKGFSDSKWNIVKRRIVYNAIKCKFSQHEDLKKFLLKTKNVYIAEAADYDRVWGIGYSADVALANENKWGQNLLGEILMQVREELK